MPIIADQYFPFDAGAGGNVGEDGWRKMARHWRNSGVLVDQLTVAQWASALLPYADSTGMQIKIHPGEVWCNGHIGIFGNEMVLPIASNSSGSSRFDLVVARADYLANNVVLDIVQGTPGGGVPVAANNSSMYEVRLGVVQVDNAVATISAAATTDYRILSGNAYGTFTPTMITRTGVALPIASGMAVISRSDRLVHVEGHVVGSGTWTAGEWSLQLPAPLYMPFQIDGVTIQPAGAANYGQSVRGVAYYRPTAIANGQGLLVVAGSNTGLVSFKDARVGASGTDSSTLTFGNTNSQVTNAGTTATPGTPSLLTFSFDYVAER